MHQNIDQILRRANAILSTAWHSPEATDEQRVALARAYGAINPGKTAQKLPLVGALPADPDGSETFTAARFVAQAMGLKLASHAELDEGQAIGPDHLVVLRAVEGVDDPQHAKRCQQAAGAGLRVDIHCQAPSLGQALARRRKSGAGDPRQPSLF